MPFQSLSVSEIDVGLELTDTTNCPLSLRLLEIGIIPMSAACSPVDLFAPKHKSGSRCPPHLHQGEEKIR